MAVNMVEEVPQDDEVGIGVPQSVPMPPGAGAATMPVQSQGGPRSSPSAMDSIITDFLISKFGGRGVQAADAAPAPPPPPAVGAPSMPVSRAALGPPMPVEPTLTPANPAGPPLPPASTAGVPMPQPRPSGAPIGVPPPTTGSANAAPTGQPPKPGSYADIAFNALKGAFGSGPAGSTTGSANAASPHASSASSAPPQVPPQVPPTPPTGGNPYSAMMPSWITNALSRQPAMGPAHGAMGQATTPGGVVSSMKQQVPPTPPTGGNPYSAMVPAWLNKVLGTKGTAEAAEAKEGPTGDELAARRQQNKVGPPNAQPYNARPSSRYTKPNAPGGVNYRPPPKGARAAAPKAPGGRSSSSQQQRAQAPASKSARAAPQTARGGRSAYAQSLIDSMGPRGAGVTTYIEPATGNEILTGGGMYMNLGKTSTGTQKPSYTRFFDK